MRLVWTAEARVELRSIVTFVADFNPAAATRLLDLIENYAERLPEHPLMGRPGRVPGTREGVIHPIT